MFRWTHSSHGSSILFCDVLTVGAGISGLAATQAIKNGGSIDLDKILPPKKSAESEDAGLAPLPPSETATSHTSVVCVEARDRVGGRLWSPEQISGISIDLGASWIHGTAGNPLSEWAQRLNIRTELSSEGLYKEWDAIVFEKDGTRVPHEVYVSMHKLFWGLIQEMEEQDIPAHVSLEGDRSVASIMEFKLQKATKKLSPTEKSAFLASKNYVEEYNAASLNDLSVNAWMADEEFPGPQKVVGGYAQIPKALSQGLDIHLNSPVQEIDWTSRDIIKVKTTNGKTIYTRRLLLTTPLGVLKSGTIRFNPPLPDWKQKAINSIGVGTLNKIVMSFKRAFWEDSCTKSTEFFSYVGEEDSSYHFLNLNKTFGVPAFIAFTYGQDAVNKEEWSDARISDHIMEALRKMFPGQTEEDYKPQKVIVTRWTKEPFTLGSYSYMKVGSSGEDYDALARPIDNRIFFAGEATLKEYYGTVHAAYLSGVRAAQEILTSLKRNLPTNTLPTSSYNSSPYLTSTPVPPPPSALSSSTTS